MRKRTAREVEQAHRYALEKFAQELLAVRDSLELAVANGPRADAASLVAGQEATLKLLAKAFDRFAIQRWIRGANRSIRSATRRLPCASPPLPRPTPCWRSCSPATNSTAGCFARRA